MFNINTTEKHQVGFPISLINISSNCIWGSHHFGHFWLFQLVRRRSNWKPCAPWRTPCAAATSRSCRGRSARDSPPTWTPRSCGVHGLPWNRMGRELVGEKLIEIIWRVAEYAGFVNATYQLPKLFFEAFVDGRSARSKRSLLPSLGSTRPSSDATSTLC